MEWKSGSMPIIYQGWAEGDFKKWKGEVQKMQNLTKNKTGKRLLWVFFFFFIHRENPDTQIRGISKK